MKRKFASLTAVPSRRLRKRTRRIGPALTPFSGRTSITEVKSFDCAPVQGGGGGALVNYATPPTFVEPTVAFSGMTCINEVQQGAAFYNRVGAKIVIRSVRMSFDCYPAAAVTAAVVRYMLVYDKQCNGVAPAYATINFGQPVAGTPFACGMSMVNKSRFSIIRDGYVTLSTGSVPTHVDLYCKGRWETEYSSTDGDIGDITTGAIYFLAFSNNFGVTTLVNMASRIRYYD